jgi:hypothetical protein
MDFEKNTPPSGVGWGIRQNGFAGESPSAFTGSLTLIQTLKFEFLSHFSQKNLQIKGKKHAP